MSSGEREINISLAYGMLVDKLLAQVGTGLRSEWDCQSPSTALPLGAVVAG